jgi:hypothetical protein
MDNYIRNGRTKAYGPGTDEELEMFDHDHEGAIYKIREIFNERIKKIMNIQDENRHKFLLIDKIMRWFKRGDCSICGGGWEASSWKHGFDKPKECRRCGAKVMHHERLASYLWAISDVIDGTYEEWTK